MTARDIANKAKPKARGMKGGKSIVQRAKDSPADPSGKKMAGYNLLAMAGKKTKGTK